METLVRRLKFYGIGFGLGLVFVIFFFQNRGCSWTPSNRVKNAVLDRLIVVSDSTAILLKEKGISYNLVIQALNDGDVDFGKSNKTKNGKAYLIEREDLSLVFTLPYESFISEVFLAKKVKGIKTTTHGGGKIIKIPNDKDMVFADSSSVVSCQQEKLGLISTPKIYYKIKSTGRIDFEKSDFALRPKPEHHITIEYKGKTIGMTMIWYKTKLNISNFHHSSLEECDI